MFVADSRYEMTPKKLGKRGIESTGGVHVVAMPQNGFARGGPESLPGLCLEPPVTGETIGQCQDAFQERFADVAGQHSLSGMPASGLARPQRPTL